ncbi:MAG: OsmC family protein [Gemmatimonadales bacterium]
MPTEHLRHATLTWAHDLVFEGGALGGPRIVIDGDSAAGPSPMVALLLAAAGCTGSDLVSILDKMRGGLTACRIEVSGTRRPDHPKRYTDIRFVFHVSGSALDNTKVRRAIDLSLEKYCSVVHSLAPDIVVTYDLVLS